MVGGVVAIVGCQMRELKVNKKDSNSSLSFQMLRSNHCSSTTNHNNKKVHNNRTNPTNHKNRKIQTGTTHIITCHSNRE